MSILNKDEALVRLWIEEGCIFTLQSPISTFEDLTNLLKAGQFCKVYVRLADHVDLLSKVLQCRHSFSSGFISRNRNH